MMATPRLRLTPQQPTCTCEWRCAEHHLCLIQLVFRVWQLALTHMCHPMQLMKTMKQALVKQIAEAVKLCSSAATGGPAGGRSDRHAKQAATDCAKFRSTDLNGTGYSKTGRCTAHLCSRQGLC